ncbi:MAG: response regulator transcription factor, partial [Anaerolineae bacterium]|nr:response regulator transcription factor [Anaerolineae bacterium]
RYSFRTLPHILVVEHDGYVARSLAYPLERAGYEVLVCGHAEEARELIEQLGLPHGAVVDLIAPNQAGDALCQWMNGFSDIPTIALLPSDASEAWLRSIRTYADAWIGKPFEPGYLVHRVQWLMHYLGDSNLPLAPLVQVDDTFAVDFVHQRILLDDCQLPLSPSETKLLHLLMRRSGCAVSTTFLASRMERACRSNGASEEAVHGIASALQQKIAALRPDRCYIHAVGCSGYAFVLPQRG